MVTLHGEDAPHASPRRRPPINIQTLDLNLLRVFDALLAERSATRAGLRLGLSQSAVSHALARLRDLVGDELFVKGSDGMAPTARAREIGEGIGAALTQLQTVLLDERFDPATASRRFTIAADPYARAVLMPRIFARVRHEAPTVELRVKHGVAGATDALDAGHLDLAIASYRRVSGRFGTWQLLVERHVWALRKDHPAAARPLTLDALADLSRLVRIAGDDEDVDGHSLSAGRGLERRAIQDDEGALNRALATIGRDHATRLTIPDTYTALAVAGASDIAALVPARLAQSLAGHFGLALFDPPYESPPVPLSMVWHPGHGASPGARWLRGLIRAEAETL